MALVLIATPGAWNANSYETSDEADAYFESRLPLDPEWDAADSKDALLVMSTRELDSMFRGQKTIVWPQGNRSAYYVVRRTWNGTPASTTQKLAWPRLGLFDQNRNPLDFRIESVSVAAAAVVTTNIPHRQQTGDTVFINGSATTPSIDGAQVVTVLSPTTFSVPITTTVGSGENGIVTFIPLDLKDAVAEFAGQLNIGDRTLDSDVSVQGITSARAGSVAVTFKNEFIDAKVLPDAVINLLVPNWYTEELYEPAQPAEFEVLGR